MGKFTASQEKNIYEDIIIDWNGVEYTVPFPMTVKRLKELQAVEKQTGIDDIEGLAKQMVLLTDMPVEIASEIDVRIINDMLAYIQKEMLSPKKKSVEIKNATGSGKKESA